MLLGVTDDPITHQSVVVVGLPSTACCQILHAFMLLCLGSQQRECGVWILPASVSLSDLSW